MSFLQLNPWFTFDPAIVFGGGGGDLTPPPRAALGPKFLP